MISQAEDTARQTVAGLWGPVRRRLSPRRRRRPHVPICLTGLPPVSPTWIAQTFPVLCGSAPRTHTDLTETVTASAATSTEQEPAAASTERDVRFGVDAPLAEWALRETCAAAWTLPAADVCRAGPSQWCWRMAQFP